ILHCVQNDKPHRVWPTTSPCHAERSEESVPQRDLDFDALVRGADLLYILKVLYFAVAARSSSVLHGGAVGSSQQRFATAPTGLIRKGRRPWNSVFSHL